MMGRPGRYSFMRLSTLLLGCVISLPLGASDIEQRLERLEAQVQWLMERVGAQDAQAPEPIPDPPAPTVTQPAAAAPIERQPERRVSGAVAPATTGEARLRYFLRAEVIGAEPPGEPPMMDGLYTLEESLRFDPASYGVAERSVLSRYRDLTLYRSAAVLIEGVMDLPAAGTYQFQVAPKPAREGGGSPVANEMTVRLQVAGQTVIAMDGVRSWRNQTYRHELPAGQHAFTLWAVANSPGYGPAPIDSRLEIQVALPGRAGLVPLSRLVSAAP
ncbi:hypothetical protein [Thioalkalivibrio sulfidiphilus]|uniref:Uncharacterized protein n=1 Tax=Thioalkalivibrio sulfidiphilus (strain HL-EbGR7) TaxID=396588 RepID=B8GTB9_THISH|nr:hypothetical protein [Thioalkalivibrio sulfidiphilus]ACL71179.1 hypothetical protein Tgr7_0075 [Thioalkalivibrio sulfidiphilus HL-EbGr7]